jgi:HEAT repeat protein
MRIIGPPAGKRLQGVLDKVITSKGRQQIGDELLRGLAVSGNPESVGRVLQLVKAPGDPTLPGRAMRHMYEAYIRPGDQAFEVQKPDPLIPNLPTLVALAKDASVDPEAADIAIQLIAQTGSANCLKPLLALVAAPHEARFKYVIVANALGCGGPKGIADVVNALPDSGAYWKDDVTGSISGPIAKMTPRDQVLAALRELLGAKSTVSRWVAMEALLAMKSKEDASKIEALKGVKDKLVGYWGDANTENKPDPSLGERAKQIATALSSG